MGGTTTWQGMGVSVPSLAPNKSALFPDVCKLANGDLLMVTPRMTTHLTGDGELWKQTGTDNGDGTASWRGDWVKIYAQKDSAWDVRSGLCSRVPSGTHAGKIVVAVSDTHWLASRLNIDYLSPWPTVSVQCFCRILISTDATATTFVELATLPPAFPGIAPNCNDFPESRVVFLPNGDWMVATYSRETHDYIGWYSSAYFRSTDEGANWTHEGFVARANTANTNQDTAQQCDEPQLLMLQNGEMLCAIRWLEEGRPPDYTDGVVHKMFRCSNPTARGAMTWVDEGVCSVSQAGSRPALLQHSSGMVVHAYRSYTGGFAKQGVYRCSNDDAHTWTAERNLDNGVLTAGDSGTGIYSYGGWVELANGGLLHEFSQDNSPATNSVVREARISVVSDVAALSLVANSVWSLSGTTLTVNSAPSGTRSIVSGTAGSVNGGLVRFTGTHADRFSVSLDGRSTRL